MNKTREITKHSCPYPAKAGYVSYAGRWAPAKKETMKHQKWIKNYEEDFEKLATEIGDLRYDSLEIFLSLLSDKIKQDSTKDAERQRYKLAKSLESCSDELKKATKNIEEAWRISKPFMKPKDLK